MDKTLAQLTNPVLPEKLGGTGTAQGGSVVGLLVSNIVGIFLIIAALFAFVYLLTGGLQWITSGGEKQQLEQARNKITNAMIGLIIVAGSYALFTLIGNFVGITLPEIKLPSF